MCCWCVTLNRPSQSSGFAVKDPDSHKAMTPLHETRTAHISGMYSAVYVICLCEISISRWQYTGVGSYENLQGSGAEG